MDQGVFTYLIEKLGVKDVQFEELTTLDVDELRSLGDIYGVIFLFKYPTGEKASDVPKDGTYDHEAANKLFFAAQTIQNIGKELKEFKEFAGEFPPEVGEAV
jgi:ubiquitin carboxyl-terminal hydrolase L5